MKSEHRHELETNELARRLAELVRRVKPYYSTILTGIIVVLAAIVAAGYVQKSTAARQGEAWNNYNDAVEGRTPDLELLKQSAELYAGSKMSQLSEITWADGQLWQASRRFISFRDSAMDYLNKAESAYLSLVDSADNPRIRDRAHFGLGRVYELKNELDKAREHYSAVTGGFAEIARERLEALSKEQTIEATDWLASAKPTPRQSPLGPGTPGEKPEFEADELSMFEEETEEGLGLGEMLQDIGGAGDDDEDRYSIELPEFEGVVTEENDTEAGAGQELLEFDAEITGDEDTTPESEQGAAEQTGAPSGGEGDEAAEESQNP